MRIGLRIPPCGPVDQVAACAQRAEALGYDMAWFPDSQLLWRDAFVAMAFAARATTTIGLGSAVTNLVTRHPSVVASLVRTVQEVAGDRISLGVGAGSSSVRPFGLTLATSAELAAGLEQIRKLLAGGVADFGGHRVSMRSTRESCPMYLAVTGPNRLRLAGRIADGAIFHRGTTPWHVEMAREAVERGAAETGRTLDGFELIVSGITMVTDDLERDARLVKPICRTMFQDGGGDALRAAGIEVAERPLPAGMLPAQDFKHGSDWERAVAEADEVVSDEAAVQFAREFCFTGTAPQIFEQIDRLASIGVSQVLLQDLSSHELPWQLMDALRPGA